MEKTLGGDRLGAGKKMKVQLHNYERSTHDLGYTWRTTMAPGTLVPFMKILAQPGDTFDIDLQCFMNTHPTIGPLFGSFKAQLDVFQAPIRLYQGLLHNNALGIGMKMDKVKFPRINLTAHATTGAPDTDNSQINPSCVLHYLGIKGVGTIIPPDTNRSRDFCAIPYLAYVEIYKQYYANKQEEIGAVIHTAATAIVKTVTSLKVWKAVNSTEQTIPLAPATPVQQILTTGDQIRIYYTGAVPKPEEITVTTENGKETLAQLTGQTQWPNMLTHLQWTWNNGTTGQRTISQWEYANPAALSQKPPLVSTFPLKNIDDMRKEILVWQSETNPYTINENGQPPYSWITDQTDGIPNTLSNQEGLLLKTYQSDINNNWIQTEWIDGTGGINEITAIDTTSGSFNIDTLLLSRKVYDILNRIAVSGGSYNDWLDAVYTHPRYQLCESPMYMGGLSKELVFQEVIGQASATTTNQTGAPLGTLAGKGTMSAKHKGGKIVIKVDEPSYIIGIVSLTPRVDYSQGNDWDIHLQTMDDLHKPGLDEIGFQELITEQLSWWETKFDVAQNKWIQNSAGKQPAWINYMTAVNQTHGNFAIADNEMFMTLNRRYEQDPTTKGIKDLTTYIDPMKFNFIFAETARDAQNFWVQIGCDIIARRKISAKLMPNL